MKLMDANKEKVVFEMTVEEMKVIRGMFGMIGALEKPNWLDSTGEDDTALTEERFDKVYDEMSDCVCSFYDKMARE